MRAQVNLTMDYRQRRALSVGENSAELLNDSVTNSNTSKIHEEMEIKNEDLDDEESNLFVDEFVDTDSELLLVNESNKIFTNMTNTQKTTPCPDQTINDTTTPTPNHRKYYFNSNKYFH